MTDARVMVVLGGDSRDRSATVADLLLERGGTALILTSDPGAVDSRLDTTELGPVEVRADSPPARLESYVSGAEAPDEDVLLALATGWDSPLASVLSWEYARRAWEAGFWDTIVVELDGDTAAVRKLAAPGELAAFVESRWPAHQRFASMAAGDRVDARLREAHRLAQLASVVCSFLAGGVEIVAVGASAFRVGLLADFARGAVIPAVTADGQGGFRLEVAAPSQPLSAPTIVGGQLRLDLCGFRASLALPALLSRCVLVDSHYDVAAGEVVMEFVPDTDLWPANLVPPGFAGRTG